MCNVVAKALIVRGRDTSITLVKFSKFLETFKRLYVTENVNNDPIKRIILLDVWHGGAYSRLQLGFKISSWLAKSSLLAFLPDSVMLSRMSRACSVSKWKCNELELKEIELAEFCCTFSKADVGLFIQEFCSGYWQ